MALKQYATRINPKVVQVGTKEGTIIISLAELNAKFHDKKTAIVCERAWAESVGLKRSVRNSSQVVKDVSNQSEGVKNKQRIVIPDLVGMIKGTRLKRAFIIPCENCKRPLMFTPKAIKRILEGKTLTSKCSCGAEIPYSYDSLRVTHHREWDSLRKTDRPRNL